jgi:hypothetical protein
MKNPFYHLFLHFDFKSLSIFTPFPIFFITSFSTFTKSTMQLNPWPHLGLKTHPQFLSFILDFYHTLDFPLAMVAKVNLEVLSLKDLVEVYA